MNTVSAPFKGKNFEVLQGAKQGNREYQNNEIEVIQVKIAALALATKEHNMGELWKNKKNVAEETCLNLFQHATQGEIDSFLALLEENGLKIIEVEKYNMVMSAVDQSIGTIESLKSCIAAQSDEIAGLENRIKTLMRP